MVRKGTSGRSTKTGGPLGAALFIILAGLGSTLGVLLAGLISEDAFGVYPGAEGTGLLKPPPGPPFVLAAPFGIFILFFLLYIRHRRGRVH